MSCGMCIEVCLVGAIEMIPFKGGYGSAKIDAEKCIDCGMCKDICPGDAIEG